MTDEMIRIAARMSVHEFLLEQVFANEALNAPDPLMQWDRFAEHLIEKVRYASWSDTDSPQLQAIQREATIVAERFCTKVRQRITKK